jgi:hypothetical protein
MSTRPLRHGPNLVAEYLRHFLKRRESALQRKAFDRGQSFALNRWRSELQRERAERERAEMLAELAKAKAEMLGDYPDIRERLDEALAELHKRRMLHATSRAQREEINRMHALALAAATQRDPAAPLN